MSQPLRKYSVVASFSLSSVNTNTPLTNGAIVVGLKRKAVPEITRYSLCNVKARHINETQCWTGSQCAMWSSRMMYSHCSVLLSRWAAACWTSRSFVSLQIYHSHCGKWLYHSHWAQRWGTHESLWPILHRTERGTASSLANGSNRRFGVLWLLGDSGALKSPEWLQAFMPL